MNDGIEQLPVDRVNFAISDWRPRSRLRIGDNVVVVTTDAQMPNWWWRLWYWALLGWTWEPVESGKNS